MIDMSLPQIFRSQLCPSSVSPTSRFVFGFFLSALYGKSQLETETKQQEGELATCPLAITGKGLLLYALLMRSLRLSKGWFDSRTGGRWYNCSFSKIADPRLLLFC
jgi:hypothetical protein